MILASAFMHEPPAAFANKVDEAAKTVNTSTIALNFINNLFICSPSCTPAGEAYLSRFCAIDLFLTPHYLIIPSSKYGKTMLMPKSFLKNAMSLRKKFDLHSMVI